MLWPKGASWRYKVAAAPPTRTRASHVSSARCARPNAAPATAAISAAPVPPSSSSCRRRSHGWSEIRAADDIAIAFHAQAGALLIKSPCLERRDPTHHGREPVFVIDAVSRYKHWAHHWSARARRGDRTLEIVIAAVIDERAFHGIEADLGIRHGVAARVVIAGLRDYAARAGWADRRTAAAWLDAAEASFALRPVADLAEL